MLKSVVTSLSLTVEDTDEILSDPVDNEEKLAELEQHF